VTEDLRVSFQVHADLLPRFPNGGREEAPVFHTMASPWETDLPGPWVPFPFPSHAEEEIEAALALS